MASKQHPKVHAVEAPEREEGDAPAFCLDIAIDERHGVLSVYDPRAFHAGRRGFCHRLIEAAAGVPGVEKAEIDLTSAACRLEFDRRWATAQTMADTFAAAVRRAAETPSVGDRLRFWRRPTRWSTLTAYRTAGGVSSWETLEAHPGRIRLRHAAPPDDRDRLAGLPGILSGVDGVNACRISPWFGTVIIDYRAGSPIGDRLVDVVEDALRSDDPLRSSRAELAPRDRSSGDVVVATGYRRLKHLALAGGSFALTLLGLVVPGIPTVPFLLATSYYLARSSPWLNDRLRHAPLFGAILVEWERYHGLSVTSKAELMGLTLAIVAVTVAVASGSAVVLVVIFIVAVASLYGVARLPGLPPEARPGLGTGRGARLALPSP